jgi:hypothetical protein
MKLIKKKQKKTMPKKKIAIKRIMTKFDIKIKWNQMFKEKSNEIKCLGMEL